MISGTHGIIWNGKGSIISLMVVLVVMKNRQISWAFEHYPHIKMGVFLFHTVPPANSWCSSTWKADLRYQLELSSSCALSPKAPFICSCVLMSPSNSYCNLLAIVSNQHQEMGHLRDVRSWGLWHHWRHGCCYPESVLVIVRTGS